MCRLICNLPELNIRICDPKYIPFYKAEAKRIENTYTICCQIFRYAQQLVQIRQNITLVDYKQQRIENTYISCCQIFRCAQQLVQI